MPAVNKDVGTIRLAELLREFGADTPPERVDLLIKNDPDLAQEIDLYLVGVQWKNLANKHFFDVKQARVDIDLGNIFLNLSRAGFRYFLPGLLAHFLMASKTNILGPTFYYGFISRLQFDDKDVLKYGGPDNYFAPTHGQKFLTESIMQDLLVKNGDDYERFVGLGYEHGDLERFSLRRALDNYWSL